VVYLLFCVSYFGCPAIPACIALTVCLTYLLIAKMNERMNNRSSSCT